MEVKKTKGKNKAAKTETTAVANLNTDLATIGGFEGLPENLEITSTSPYLAFYHGNSGSAADMQIGYPGVEAGHPLISVDGSFYDAQGARFFLLAEWPFYALLDKSGRKMLGASLTKPPSKTGPIEGSRWNENLLTVALILGTKAPVERYGKVIATTTTWRGAKCPAPKATLKAIEKAMTPEWAKTGLNAPVAATLPPRFRVISGFKIEAKTAHNGFVYHTARAIIATVDSEAIAALTEWSRDEKAQEARLAVMEAFENRKQEITALSERPIQAPQPQSA